MKAIIEAEQTTITVENPNGLTVTIVDDPVPVTVMKVGLNSSFHTYAYSEKPFLNLFKSANQNIRVKTVFFTSSKYFQPGKYRLEWKGDAVLYCNEWDEYLIQDEPGLRVYDVPPNAPGKFWVAVESGDRTTITDEALVHERDWDRHAQGLHVSTRVLDVYQGIKCWRAVQPIQVNNSPITHVNHVPKLHWVSWVKHWPVEVIVEFANALKIELLEVTVPVMLEGEQRLAYLQMYKDAGLSAEIKFGPSFGNETLFNFGLPYIGSTIWLRWAHNPTRWAEATTTPRYFRLADDLPDLVEGEPVHSFENMYGATHSHVTGGKTLLVKDYHNRTFTLTRLGGGWANLDGIKQLTLKQETGGEKTLSNYMEQHKLVWDDAIAVFGKDQVQPVIDFQHAGRHSAAQMCSWPIFREYKPLAQTAPYMNTGTVKNLVDWGATQEQAEAVAVDWKSPDLTLERIIANIKLYIDLRCVGWAKEHHKAITEGGGTYGLYEWGPHFTFTDKDSHGVSKNPERDAWLVKLVASPEYADLLDYYYTEMATVGIKYANWYAGIDGAFPFFIMLNPEDQEYITGQVFRKYVDQGGVPLAA